MKPDDKAPFGQRHRWHARHNPVGPGARVGFVRTARGARVELDDGSRLLDFSCGAVLPLGHDSPEVRDWLAGAALTVDGSGLERLERVVLRHKLAEIVPGGTNRRVRFCDSGPEALAAAVSLACRRTGRSRVAYLDAVRGRLDGGLADAAALVAHPFDPRLKQAARACRRDGALLVSDETRLAPGITGALTALQGAPARADLTAFGPGLAAGLPFGAVVTASSTLRWPEADRGGTPAACRVALEFISRLEAGLLEAVAALGGRLAEALTGLRAGEVRGLGLSFVLASERPDAAALAGACFRHGLIVTAAAQNALRFEPPMVATEADIESALAALRQALAEVRK